MKKKVTVNDIFKELGTTFEKFEESLQKSWRENPRSFSTRVARIAEDFILNKATFLSSGAVVKLTKGNKKYIADEYYRLLKLTEGKGVITLQVLNLIKEHIAFNIALKVKHNRVGSPNSIAPLSPKE